MPMHYCCIICLFLLLVGMAPAGAQKPGELLHRQTAGVRPDSTTLPLIWRVRDRALRVGEAVEVDFLAFGFRDIAAYQFGLWFDTAQLHFEGVEVLTTLIPLDPSGNFGLFNVAGGEIRTLWSVTVGMTLPEATPVFRLRFTARAAGKLLREVLNIDPALISAIAYNTVLASRPVELAYADYRKIYPRGQAPSQASASLSVRPNPFRDRAVVGFTLADAGEAQLRVLDSSGREWMRIEGYYPAGYNEVSIGAGEMPVAGLFFVALNTAQGKYFYKTMKIDE